MVNWLMMVEVYWLIDVTQCWSNSWCDWFIDRQPVRPAINMLSQQPLIGDGCLLTVWLMAGYWWLVIDCWWLLRKRAQGSVTMSQQYWWFTHVVWPWSLDDRRSHPRICDNNTGLFIGGLPHRLWWLQAEDCDFCFGMLVIHGLPGISPCVLHVACLILSSPVL